MKDKYPKLIFKCNECGKPQPKNEEQSNESWEVFDTNVKCECGGAFESELIWKPTTQQSLDKGEE